DGSRRGVSAQEVQRDDGTVGFRLGAYDPSLPLLIDPVVPASSYLGGTGDDFANGVAVDGQGGTYVARRTASSDVPTTLGAYHRALTGTTDAFLTKLNAAGTAVVYSTYLGGNESIGQTGSGEWANAVAVDLAGDAFLAGVTSASDFPTTSGALQTGWNSGFNGLATKLSATGDALLYSTYFGQGTVPVINAVAVDAKGAAYITGSVPGANVSSGFPTTSGAYRTTAPTITGTDGFVAKLNPAGSALS